MVSAIPPLMTQSYFYRPIVEERVAAAERINSRIEGALSYSSLIARILLMKTTRNGIVTEC